MRASCNWTLTVRNLNALFNTASQPVELRASQADQTATLFKRPRSSNWQVRFKLPSGGWHAASTGRADLASAKPTALEIQQQVLAQLSAGESISKKTFGAVAAEEIAAMQRAFRRPPVFSSTALRQPRFAPFPAPPTRLLKYCYHSGSQTSSGLHGKSVSSGRSHVASRGLAGLDCR